LMKIAFTSPYPAKKLSFAEKFAVF